MIRNFRPQALTGGVISIVLGAFIALIGLGNLPTRNGLSAGIIMTLIGLGLLAVGVLLVLRVRRNRVSDTEVDETIMTQTATQAA
ncbi:MAG: hypothetical protein K9G24_02335 [Candidatus Nanopelagicales bacterium]|nr:hypothetical protein [Candidatus Nanopelagicales bacterium]MCF8538254.1 hypothetical protein [Candidatus Nanopelagicales bacterium]MCF8541901.1 hypothetical protein [Candidatus Nanopelagicales bacterium]MCF8556635.1 hypothetical protein [Candidatus Nanopelagicales bacterium]